MRDNKHIAKIQGFTLVELSIVIIIIGFLIAGISAGQSLVKQAGLTSAISEYGNYITAFRAFKARYNYLPGDFPNAESYWPTSEDGDGNGVIDNDGRYEQLKLWKHLSLAGMVNGNYTGILPGVVGESFPRSKLSSLAGFNTDYFVAYGKTENQLAITGGGGNGSAMSPQDASVMDNKMDDGNPGVGRMVILRGVEYLFDTDKCVDQDIFQPLGTTVNFLFEDTSVSCRTWFYFDNN